MDKKKRVWQLPFLAILIIGTIIILKKQAPFRTDEALYSVLCTKSPTSPKTT